MNYPDDPADAAVHDLGNMIDLHREGRVTSENVVSAIRGILSNYERQTEGRKKP